MLNIYCCNGRFSNEASWQSMVWCLFFYFSKAWTNYNLRSFCIQSDQLFCQALENKLAVYSPENNCVVSLDYNTFWDGATQHITYLIIFTIDLLWTRPTTHSTLYISVLAASTLFFILIWSPIGQSVFLEYTAHYVFNNQNYCYVIRSYDVCLSAELLIGDFHESCGLDAV